MRDNFKRYMMECVLSEEPVGENRLPHEYLWVPWSEAMVERHAAVLYQSFQDSPDARILPALSTLTGCRVLARSLARWRGFCPCANWLITHQDGEDVACLQAALDSGVYGVIINLAVLPSHRGRGLGSALLRRGLCGLYEAGVRRVYLEVTASNLAAAHLYRRHHFRCYKTLYREALIGEVRGRDPDAAGEIRAGPQSGCPNWEEPL
jgi:hypothetical protein